MNGPPVDGLRDVEILTDIHAHPSLNAFVFDRDLRRHYCAGRTFNPLSSLSDFRMLEKGGVRVLWCAHTVPEQDFFDCKALRLLARLTRGGRALLRLSPWECLLSMMDRMEFEVSRASNRFRVVRSTGELDEAIRSGRTAVVHTVEGGHVLEGDVDRLDILKERGVASFTLAHLFPNDVAGHTVGIHPSYPDIPFCRIDQKVDPERGLTPFGRDVVRRLVHLGVIPDITHATPRARSEILDIVDNRIPVIASHVGVQAHFPSPYNLSDDEIERIAASNGLVGIIFMPLWLSADAPRNGLNAIWQTMSHIRDVTGTWRHVALGTDFDGFTDPPDDIAGAAKLPRIREMLREKRLSQGEIVSVLGGNARRVLSLTF